MFTWAKIPFVRITIFFIIGIWLAISYPGHTLIVAILCLLLGMGQVFLEKFKGRIFLRYNYIYGLNISLLFILLGYLTTWLHSENYNPDNLIHKSGITEYIAQIKSEADVRGRFLKYKLSVKKVKIDSGWQKTDGLILAYLELAQDVNPAYGDNLLIRGHPSLVSEPRNPGEFKYKNYLANKQIFLTHWVNKQDWYLQSKSSEFAILDYANRSRIKLETILEKSVRDSSAQGILKALVLGNKEDLDQNTKDVFAKAGAMHVLAVSGLHVGIIYLILILILKPLSSKISIPWFQTFIILSFLFAYAFITGLSPSVMRAVTMFAIIEIGRRINRNTSSMNSLAISAFILLWLDPYLITQVGFQLSYAAVAGIILLYRPFSSIYQSKHKVVRFIWQITAVSIIAQLATAPLAAYYFHQFPTYFFLTNLIIIPAVTVLVWGGVALLGFGSFSIEISSIIGQALELIIKSINGALELVVNLPFASITDIWLEHYELVLLYLILISFLALLVYKKAVLRIAFATLVLIFAISTMIITSQKRNSKRLIIYSLNKGQWAIDFFNNGEYVAFSDSSLEQSTINYSIKPLRDKSQVRPSNITIDQKKIDGVGEIIVWQDKKILIAETCAHNLDYLEVFDFIHQPNHPRFMDCYSDQNLLIKLVDEDRFYGYPISKKAFITDI